MGEMLQRRVSGTCADDQTIRVVNADGTVSCVAVGGGGGGGTLEQTSASCTITGGDTGSCTVACPSGYIRSGCAVSCDVGGQALTGCRSQASGSNACFGAILGSGGGIVTGYSYVYCLRLN